MNMKCGLKVKVINQDGGDINQPGRGMVNVNMPTADLAPLAVAEPSLILFGSGLIIFAKIFGAFGHFESFGLPEGKCVNGSGGPFPA